MKYYKSEINKEIIYEIGNAYSTYLSNKKKIDIKEVREEFRRKGINRENRKY